MNNKNCYIWFNIGQKEISLYSSRVKSRTHGVTWQSAVINLDFDVSSIRFDTCEWDENDNPIEKWVPIEELDYKFHHSVEKSFTDLNKVAEWVKESYEIGEDIYVGDNNWLHIYNIYDMDNVNEYGVALGLLD